MFLLFGVMIVCVIAFLLIILIGLSVSTAGNVSFHYTFMCV